jgi:hypothetical protein
MRAYAEGCCSAHGHPPPAAVRGLLEFGVFTNYSRWPPPLPSSVDGSSLLVLLQGLSGERATVFLWAGAAGSLGVLTMVILARRAFRMRTGGYAGVARSELGTTVDSGNQLLRVSFELSNGLREDGEVSLAAVHSVKALRLALLQVADDLLLDPEDDLGEWTLRFTDRDRAGALSPVTTGVSVSELRRRALELRVTAGAPLRAASVSSENSAAVATITRAPVPWHAV